MSSENYDIIIIGSGLGGLLSGYILAKEGKKVCILEKSKVPGGCLQSFRRNGHIFDTGVHYFGAYDEGQTLNRYWRYFNLTGNLSVERMDEKGHDIISFGGKMYPLASGKENFVNRLLPCFPKSEKNLKRYISELGRIAASFPLYNLEIPAGNENEIYKSRNAWDFFQSFSEEGDLLANVLSGNNFLYAGNKKKTPLHVAALINHSFLQSAWRPLNGSEQIATELIKNIRLLGGELLTDSKVTKIEKKAGTFTIGTKDQSFTTGTVISDIHPSATLGLLSGIPVRKVYSARLSSLINTGSVFSLFVDTKEKSIPHINHNIHHFRNNSTWVDGNHENPQGFMLYTIPSSDKEWASGLVIMCRMDFERFRPWENSSTCKRDLSYEEFKSDKALEMLMFAETIFPGLSKNADHITVSTPLTWRDHTGTPQGSMFGIERDCNEPLKSIVMPATKIPGLFFTGQNTNIHGVLGVTIGAVHTCGELLGLEYLLKKIRNV